MSLIWFLLIGLIAGWLAGKIMKGGGYGVVGDIIASALWGPCSAAGVFGMLGIAAYGLVGSLITATIGAILVIFLIRLIKKADTHGRNVTSKERYHVAPVATSVPKIRSICRLVR